MQSSENSSSAFLHNRIDQVDKAFEECSDESSEIMEIDSQLESNLIKIVDEQVCDQKETIPPVFEPHVTDKNKNVLATQIPEVVPIIASDN